VLPYV